METDLESYVAECFWPDVGNADLAALDQRIDRVVAELPWKVSLRRSNERQTARAPS